MGLRITNAALIRTALADVGRQKARLAQAQEQASSGLRVNRPSDDPSDASAALLLRSGIDANAQFEENATRAGVRLAAMDSALSTTTDTLIRARELAIAGANDTYDASTRALLAREIEGLHARLLGEANTRSGPGYVFAGLASDTQPFAVSGPFGNPGPSPTVAFVADATEIEVAVDEGIRLRGTLNGERVFLGDRDGDGAADPGREDLFQVLSDLRDALQANDRAAIAAILPRIDTGMDQIAVERADLGATETRLLDIGDRLAQRNVDLRTRLSLAEDADAAEVFSALVNEENGLRAALAAAQRAIQPSLLDFLGPV